MDKLKNWSLVFWGKEQIASAAPAHQRAQHDRRPTASKKKPRVHHFKATIQGIERRVKITTSCCAWLCLRILPKPVLPKESSHPRSLNRTSHHAFHPHHQRQNIPQVEESDSVSLNARRNADK
jgi:hypothetical protein